MKKILVLVMALAFIVSAFAATEVPATLSVTNPVFEGAVSFEVGFDENGLDLMFGNTLKVTTAFSSGYSATFGGNEGGMLTAVLSGDLVGLAKDTTPAFSLVSITYEDNMLKAVFNNSGIKEYSKYIVYNEDANGDGALDLSAVGAHHAIVTLKDLGFEFLYVDLTSTDDVKSDATQTDNPVMLNGDLFAAKYSLSVVPQFDVDLTAGFWAADPATRLAVSTPATKTGFAVAAAFTGKEAVSGLTGEFFFGSQEGSSTYLLSASYKKDFEAGMFTVTPHTTFDFAKATTLPAFVKPVSDATQVTFGADLSADFGVAGSISLTDKVTLPLPGDMTYTYAVEYSNKIHDLFNIESLKVSKADGTEIATPLSLSAKVSGSQTFDAVSAAYDVTLNSVDLDKVSDEYAVDAHSKVGYEADMVTVSLNAWYKLHAATKDATNNLAYDVSVTVNPVDKVDVKLSMKNYTDSDSDGNIFEETFNEPSEFLYTADVTYSPNDVITTGVHVSNASFGSKDLYWNAYIKGSVSF
ncbi:hypothetical protein X275_04595 [Marinitoga sp. 1197]|uniref:hypothetical protein n=1 Tax=Marinitoga sp. 1197 TaxID=1428449 RepID=UPI000640BAB6|nr:hypothetical protein [Marinitoga sp. 1197]KLO22844.1 hypothetical protein X275_04595 [Marinitoga sp. 1197]